jgi:hypothetical protein
MPAPPLALTDAQITTVMQLSRPLLPAQRVAFVELLVARINDRREIGEICRELQRQVLGAPQLGHEPGTRSKYR